MRSAKKIVCCVLALVLLCLPLVSCNALRGCRKKTPAEDTPPVKEGVGIYGVADAQTVAGKFFNVMEGVTARTESGQDITADISVTGELDTSRAGEYTLVYSVEHNGESERAERKITVTPNPALGQEDPVFIYEAQQPFNIAKGCAVTASSVYGNALPSFVTDGDLSTRWESEHFGDPVAGEHPVDLTVDLGETLPFEAVHIWWEAAYAARFSLLISSDGRNYTPVVAPDAAPAPTVENGKYVHRFAFPEQPSARYVRLRCIERTTAFGYSVFELQVFGRKGTVIPEEDYPVLLRARNEQEKDWTVAKEEWAVFDLGGQKEVGAFTLSWLQYLSPASFGVYYSADGQAYTRVGLVNQPYSADSYYFYPYGGNNAQTQSIRARYFKVEMYALRFYVPAYRITDVQFKASPDTQKYAVAAVSVSSAQEGCAATNMTDNSTDTYWENAHTAGPQTIDLGSVQDVGRIDLYWRGDDGGKGKYYDLQVAATDAPEESDFVTVFRQNHGATQKQSVYYYGKARYIRVIDYQSPDAARYMLEGMEVFSQYPDGYERRETYDTSLSFPQQEVLAAPNGNGSYVTGDVTFPSARLIAYLDKSLRDKPVPSNDWWQGLLMRDKGYNMYLNPLVAAFSERGLWLTNPGDGYYSGDNPGNGRQTIVTEARDICIGYRGMRQDAEVRVVDYSDYGIAAVATDNTAVDKLTVFLSQGSLYAYCLFAEPQKATVASDNLVAAFDLNGAPVLQTVGESYTGDCIVVCVRTQSGYENNVEKGNAKQYEERFYVVNTPADTQFVREENHIAAVMQKGNYMSVGAMSGVVTVSAAQAAQPIAHGAPDTDEATLLHAHGYAFVTGTSCTYSVDETTNDVTTVYKAQTYAVKQGASAEAITAFMPHHYKKSQDKCSQTYVYSSVRGDIRAHTGNTYETVDKFYGVVPTFTEPNDDGYSAQVLYDQLCMLYKNNGGDAPPDKSLVSGDPYWQGKNLHPMAMAALAADQIGAIELRDAFLQKIRYILEDWFTYTPGEETDGKSAYFYYDDEWGTLYYRNSEFGAGVNLADHHFTYGYYMLAAGVLSAYQPDFAVTYKDMIELLLRDYMNTDRNDDMFPFMRNYDVFAGHGWAGGYADNDGGNNQESAGEALNSWVGAYLYACAVGNDEVKKAAMYGFTTELNAVKTYWFNYDGDGFADFYPFGTLGQLYGASNFFGTFFNGEPLYMYGIHLIPGEEFLTSYALNAKEQAQLKRMMEKMRAEQASWNTSEDHKRIYAWQHIFIPIVASYDPDEAIAWYEQTLAEQGNVGNTSEQFNVYWMIHGLRSLGSRSTDIWAENGMPATVYYKNGHYTALCYNPAQTAVRYTFRNANGVTGSALVPAGGLVTADPLQVTDTFPDYIEADALTPDGYAYGSGVQTAGQTVTFRNGSATYYAAFGNTARYRRFRLFGDLSGASVTVGDTTYDLHDDNGRLVTQPLLLTFNQTVTVRAASGTLTGITLQDMALLRVDTTDATASADSVNGNATADKILDGVEDARHRWESEHGIDNVWVEIVLPRPTELWQLHIAWEAASAKEYKVFFSESAAGEDFTQVAHVISSTGGNRTDTVSPSAVLQVRRIRIQCIARITDYGYSIMEIYCYNFTGV